MGLLRMKPREEGSSWNCSTPLKCLVGSVPPRWNPVYLEHSFSSIISLYRRNVTIAASCVSVLIAKLCQKWEEELNFSLSVFKGWKMFSATP